MSEFDGENIDRLHLAMKLKEDIDKDIFGG